MKGFRNYVYLSAILCEAMATSSALANGLRVYEAAEQKLATSIWLKAHPHTRSS